MMLTIPRFQLATARLATGPQVRYVEQGDPFGEPLVFLHGYTDSWWSFSPVLPLLPADYHVFAYDQRGHGESERPIGGYTVDNFAADTVAFMDAVGLARATIVGHSMGSFVARRVAASYPERVNRLVLIGSTLSPINEVTLELQAAVLALRDPVDVDFVREFQASTIHWLVPELFFEQAVAESQKLPARVWQSALGVTLPADDADQLGRIAAPTLIVWGDQDAIFPREEQDRLAAAIPGAQLVVYPETGHAVHWERPQTVAWDLQAFLRES